MLRQLGYFLLFLAGLAFLLVFLYVSDIAGSNLIYVDNQLNNTLVQLNNTLPYKTHVSFVDWSTYTMYPANVLKTILFIILVLVFAVYMIHSIRR